MEKECTSEGEKKRRLATIAIQARDDRIVEGFRLVLVIVLGISGSEWTKGTVQPSNAEAEALESLEMKRRRNERRWIRQFAARVS